jgi:outer membrane immunogenic protein
LQVSTLKRSVNLATNLAPAAFPANTIAQERLDAIGTVRGRVGYTVTPTVLLYATGGLAYADPELSTSVTTFPNGGGAACAGFCGGADTKSWRAGWTAGAGVEWKLTSAWSAKLEYLYYDMGTLSQTYR